MKNNIRISIILSTFVGSALLLGDIAFADDAETRNSNVQAIVDAEDPQLNSNQRLKHVGIDYNFLGRSSSHDYFLPSYSGSIVFFNFDRDLEFSVPVFFVREETEAHTNLETFVLDFRARRYWLTKGSSSSAAARPFIGAILRFTQINGAVYAPDAITAYFSDPPYTYQREMKSGVGFELGIRVTSGIFYWGFSVGIGQYLFGRSNHYRDADPVMSEDKKWFYDVELLKLGLFY